jgi:hypothetical protein
MTGLNGLWIEKQLKWGPNLWHYLENFLKELRKTTKNITRGSLCSRRDSNLEASKYKSEAISLDRTFLQ